MPEEIDPNPVTEVRKKGDGTIIVEKTHKFPVTSSVVYVIADVKAEIRKIDSVLTIWTEKRAPLQAIVDEYEAVE